MNQIDKLCEALSAIVSEAIAGNGIATQVAEARAALDELAAQLEAKTSAMRELELLLEGECEARCGIEDDRNALASRVADLESQLSAQPKALEWREPSTAPVSEDDATPALLVRCSDGDTYLARCDPRGRWFDDYGEELEGVAGYLLPSDLPTKGPTDG